MKRILIVDDDALIRLGLIDVLSHGLVKPVFGEASSAQKCLEQIRSEPWDLVLLDVNLPDRSGLDLVLDIRHAAPQLPVLIVSGCDENDFAIHALKAGANGFVNKKSPPAEILQAILKALNGERYLSAPLAEKLALGLLLRTERPLHEKLTEREFQVLRQLAAGQTPSQVALALSLSPKTVSTYRARILVKMNFKSNADMTRYALKHQLVD